MVAGLLQWQDFSSGVALATVDPDTLAVTLDRAELALGAVVGIVAAAITSRVIIVRSDWDPGRAEVGRPQT